MKRTVLITGIAAVCAMGSGTYAGAQAPNITRVAIARGSFNTAERSVSLAITTGGSAPTAYRASERADMSGAVWRSMANPPSFTLSSTPGHKIVFVQVGRTATVSTTTSRISQTTVTRLPGDFVPAPQTVSNIASDTIVLGLPDLRSSVTMPSVVRNGQSFNFVVSISNAGQINPSSETIQAYNSFVTNTISIESVLVTHGVSRLTGKGCVITDVPTIECSIAPLASGSSVAIQLSGRVSNGVPSGQTQVTHTLRTRITGVRESDTANNWRDTPITIVK